jgi:hypothetical protein
MTRPPFLAAALVFPAIAALIALAPSPGLSLAAGDKDAAEFPNLKPGGLGGRSGEARDRLVKEGGGNAASEAAVAEGLRWLARHQFDDGHWGLNDFDKAGQCNCGQTGNHADDFAATGFALLAFLGAGETHQAGDEKSKYTKQVEKGLKWLCNKMGADGQLGGGYSQGITSQSLCEAYALTRDPQLKPYAQRAVNKIVDWQGPNGGWRYGPKQDGDMSVSGWHIEALWAASRGRLQIPRATVEGANGFLDKVSTQDGARYGYLSGQGGTNYRMSAVGLLCRQFLGWPADKAALVKGVELMQKLPPGPNPRDILYFSHATQVMHHMSAVMPKEWDRWNVAMRDDLVKRQDAGDDVNKRHQKGSWNPTGDALVAPLGRLGYTSLCLQTLEVYYRHVPLFEKKAAP